METQTCSARFLAVPPAVTAELEDDHKNAGGSRCFTNWKNLNISTFDGIELSALQTKNLQTVSIEHQLNKNRQRVSTERQLSCKIPFAMCLTYPSLTSPSSDRKRWHSARMSSTDRKLRCFSRSNKSNRDVDHTVPCCLNNTTTTQVQPHKTQQPRNGSQQSNACD